MTPVILNIAMPESMRRYVAGRVEAGHYGTTSEYLRELIRKDQREQAITHLRKLLQEGLDSGPARACTPEDWAELRRIANSG